MKGIRNMIDQARRFSDSKYGFFITLVLLIGAYVGAMEILMRVTV